MRSDRRRRHDKAFTCRDSSSAHGKGRLAHDVAARDGSSSIARDDDEDDDEISAARRRTENSSSATAEGKEDSQGEAVSHDGTSGMKPRTTPGAWFAAQEKKKARAGSKRDDNGSESDGVDAAASDDSFSDNIVSSKRRYCGKREGMVTGRYSGNEDNTEKDGGSGNDSWASIVEGGRSPARCNSLMLSYERGNNSDLVQCVVVRDVSTRWRDRQKHI